MRALWNHERVVLLRECVGLRFWLLRKALALDVCTLFALPLGDAGTACSPGRTEPPRHLRRLVGVSQAISA